MPPIRNSSVARGLAAASTNTTIYTVPASTVLLLKDVHTGLDAANTGNIVILMNGADGSVCPLVVLTFSASAGPQSWSGWVALNAGDAISMVTAGFPVHYWVSGALLPFVPGF